MSESKTYYAVFGVIQDAPIDVVHSDGNKVHHTVPLVLVEGMIGAIPVFALKSDAKKYAKEHNLTISEFEAWL